MTFDGCSPSRRREYVDWITEAKSDATPARRLEQAVEWMAKGRDAPLEVPGQVGQTQ